MFNYLKNHKKTFEEGNFSDEEPQFKKKIRMDKKTNSIPTSEQEVEISLKTCEEEFNKPKAAISKLPKDYFQEDQSLVELFKKEKEQPQYRQYVPVHMKDQYGVFHPSFSSAARALEKKQEMQKEMERDKVAISFDQSLKTIWKTIDHVRENTCNGPNNYFEGNAPSKVQDKIKRIYGDQKLKIWRKATEIENKIKRMERDLDDMKNELTDDMTFIEEHFGVRSIDCYLPHNGLLNLTRRTTRNFQEK